MLNISVKSFFANGFTRAAITGAGWKYMKTSQGEGLRQQNVADTKATLLAEAAS